MDAFINQLPAILTALTALVAAIGTLRQIRKVHTIVNQQRTDSLTYQAQLTSALTRAGITVPKDQSLEDGKAS